MKIKDSNFSNYKSKNGGKQDIGEGCYKYLLNK